MIIELVKYPKARSLLKFGSPKDWYTNAKVFMNFVSGKDRNNNIRGK